MEKYSAYNLRFSTVFCGKTRKIVSKTRRIGLSAVENPVENVKNCGNPSRSVLRGVDGEAVILSEAQSAESKDPLPYASRLHKAGDSSGFALGMTGDQDRPYGRPE
ncbi:MAG: hypothetical protein IKX98_03265 [Clostridia bacterium]|nr:hypothetical protein [Clostridia bacterium]